MRKRRHRPVRCRSHRAVIERKKNPLLTYSVCSLPEGLLQFHIQLNYLKERILRSLFITDRVDPEVSREPQSQAP